MKCESTLKFKKYIEWVSTCLKHWGRRKEVNFSSAALHLYSQDGLSNTDGTKRLNAMILVLPDFFSCATSGFFIFDSHTFGCMAWNLWVLFSITKLCTLYPLEVELELYISHPINTHFPSNFLQLLLWDPQAFPCQLGWNLSSMFWVGPPGFSPSWPGLARFLNQAPGGHF